MKDVADTTDGKGDQSGIAGVNRALEHVFMIEHILDVTFEKREWPGRLCGPEEVQDPEIARIVRDRGNLELAYLQDRL